MSLFRMKKVNALVKRELSSLIRKHLPVEDYGLISVTEVEVSKDLKKAVVYISAIGVVPPIESVVKSLEKIRKNLQYELSRKVVMKYTPHLLFKQDLGLERGHRLVELLDTLNEGQKA